LRGIDCTKHELHLLCTESLAEGWSQLMSRFGKRNATLRHLNDRARGVVVTMRNRSVLGVEEAAFWRRCLYPWDVELHNKVCGSNRLAHLS
jgi:hypothetical protein